MSDRPAARRRAYATLLGVATALALAGGTVLATSVLADETPSQLVVTDPGLDLRGTGDASAVAPVNDFVAGVAVVPAVTALVEPTEGAAPVAILQNPTWEGFPLTFVVLEQQGAWSHVRLLMRPNNSTGWVRTAELRTYEVPNRVVIERTARRLTVYRGDSDEVLFTTEAGVGAAATPTPLGEFWIDIVNPLDGAGVYGWGQLSVSGFSEVHMTFGGGIGQIAIHGTNNPSTVGDDRSNGCIRLRNDDMVRLDELTSVGTPVSIVE